MMPTLKRFSATPIFSLVSMSEEYSEDTRMAMITQLILSEHLAQVGYKYRLE